MIALFVSVFLLVVLAMGAPLAFAMILAASVGFYIFGGLPFVLGFIGSTTLTTATTYELLAIPMFILMAEFIIVSRIANDLFDAAAVWVGRIPGGLGVATIGGGALFGAISGSSTAAAVTLSATSLPVMIDRGYDRRFAGGIVVVTATLDMLIPPSIALIFFALLADVSVAKLLIGGLVPGVIVALILTGYVMLNAVFRPHLIPAGSSYSWREKWEATAKTGPIVLLFLMVTASLYAGVVTPTETSALGAFGALVIALAKRRMTSTEFFMALQKAARTSCMIGLMLLGSYLFSYFFALTRTTEFMGNWVLSLGARPYVVLICLGLIYLLLGTFLDTIATMILTVPIVLPIIVGIGYDPIWYGIMMVLIAQIGVLTPPTGMNVFIVAKYANMPAHEIFAGVFPYIFLIIGAMVIFSIWPEIIMWLPNTMI